LAASWGLRPWEATLAAADLAPAVVPSRGDRLTGGGNGGDCVDRARPGVASVLRDVDDRADTGDVEHPSRGRRGVLQPERDVAGGEGVARGEEGVQTRRVDERHVREVDCDRLGRAVGGGHDRLDERTGRGEVDL